MFTSQIDALAKTVCEYRRGVIKRHLLECKARNKSYGSKSVVTQLEEAYRP